MKEQIIQTSQAFWKAMETADEQGMRYYADPSCQFVHIGITCGLDQEISFYTSKAFQLTKLTFNSQNVSIYDNTAVVITDCDYALLLNGTETSHHFAVTEVYIQKENEWKLVQLSFTALVY